MDQVTQIALGAAAAQAVGHSALGRKAALVGGVAAFLPDLDMLLTPLADPLFPIELHRGFTHGLVMVPVIAALTTLLLLPWRAFRGRKGAVFLLAVVGALTHAPLDILTSYGTRILWPFSPAWVALDVVSVIDPIYSLILVVGVVWALVRFSSRPARIALVLSCLYLVFGVVQRERALDAQAVLAASRGHAVSHGRVIPALGSSFVRRSFYVADGRMYADAIRLPPFVAPTVQVAGDAAIFTLADLPEHLPDAAHVRRVFERYVDFADGLLARTPGDEAVVGDMRYSLAYGFDPVWGMRIVPGEPATWADRSAEHRQALGKAIRHLAFLAWGQVGEFQPLPSREEWSRP